MVAYRWYPPEDGVVLLALGREITAAEAVSITATFLDTGQQHLVILTRFMTIEELKALFDINKVGFIIEHWITYFSAYFAEKKEHGHISVDYAFTDIQQWMWEAEDDPVDAANTTK